MTKLPQSLILVVPHGVDPAQAGRSLATADDTVIAIIEHKKPTGSATGIFVDDIRTLAGAVRTHSRQGRTIAILADAANITPPAQNALLKLLEEPRSGLYIILATSTPEALLPTVHSRCQHMAWPIDGKISRAEPPNSMPPDKQARIRFMARGNQAMADRLASDEAYYQQQLSTYTQAKQLVAASPYQRLMAIQAVADDRVQALAMADAALVILLNQLTQQYQPKLVQQLSRLYSARQAIHRNGHIRLQLLASVV